MVDIAYAAVLWLGHDSVGMVLHLFTMPADIVENDSVSQVPGKQSCQSSYDRLANYRY